MMSLKPPARRARSQPPPSHGRQKESEVRPRVPAIRARQECFLLHEGFWQVIEAGAAHSLIQHVILAQLPR